MKAISLAVLFLLAITNVFAQSNLLWSRSYNHGLDNSYMNSPVINVTGDTINTITRKQTPSGEVLLSIRYDLNGDTISTTAYGNGLVDRGNITDYEIDAGQNLYLVNRISIGYYKSKIVLSKYEPNGSMIWLKEIADSADTSYASAYLALVNDTTIFVSGYKEFDYPESSTDVVSTVSQAMLFAYNTSGQELWKRTFEPGTELSYFSHDFICRNNTAYFFTSGFQPEYRLCRIDINNALTINNNSGVINGISKAEFTSDNNIVVMSRAHYRVSKFDMNGNLIWSSLYPTNLPPNVFGDIANAMIQDEGGNIYITGRHYGDQYGTANYSNGDILTLKYNSNGILKWQSRYEYGGNNGEGGAAIFKRNGYVYVGGNSQSAGVNSNYDFVALKLDSATGAKVGEYRFNSGGTNNDHITSISVLGNGSVVLAGVSSASYGTGECITQMLSDIVLSKEESLITGLKEIYPNPVSSCGKLYLGRTYSGYSIVSCLGQTIINDHLDNNEDSIGLPSLASGVYFINLFSGSEVITRKLVID